MTEQQQNAITRLEYADEMVEHIQACLNTNYWYKAQEARDAINEVIKKLQDES